MRQKHPRLNSADRVVHQRLELAALFFGDDRHQVLHFNRALAEPLWREAWVCWLDPGKPTLLIIRDIMFMDRRHFRELLTESQENIASNILADRLQMLVGQRVLTKAHDPSHKQKAIYSLTEKGIDLLPLLLEMAGWANKHLVASRLKGLAQTLQAGGPKLQARFITELREKHLPLAGVPKTSRRSAKTARPSAGGRPVRSSSVTPTGRTRRTRT